MPEPPDLSRLQRIIRLAYEMNDDDQRQKAQAIFTQRSKAWQRALEEEAAKVGVRRRANAPRFSDLTDLQGMSNTDAASIRKTYNADLEREIVRLYNANPRGNRQYYISNLERWHSTRAEWKERQIAIYSQKTARYHAQQRFKEMNAAREQTYVFAGPAPVCDDCAEMFAAGVVEQEFVEANEAPLHVNCPHEWESNGFQLDVAKDELWMG